MSLLFGLQGRKPIFIPFSNTEYVFSGVALLVEVSKYVILIMLTHFVFVFVCFFFMQILNRSSYFENISYRSFLVKTTTFLHTQSAICRAIIQIMGHNI